jgi:hypothetical protein
MRRSAPRSASICPRAPRGFRENAAETCLRPGDVVEREIEKISTLSNPVISWQQAYRVPRRRSAAGERVGWPIDNAKLERVHTLMAAEGVHMLVARSPENVCYLTN